MTMNMKRKNTIKAIASVERAEGKMLAIATDETLDRQGDVLPIEAWDVRSFKKNPVLLWAHDYSVPPVGVAKNLRIDKEKKRMTFEPVFHELTQLAREVKAMFENDPPIMNSFSVGFIPHFEQAREGDKMVPLELLEISAVPVPANPSARLTEKAMSFEDDERATVKSWLDDNDAELPTKKEGEATATTMEVQSVVCSKEKFASADDAGNWVKDHGFRADKPEETDADFRFPQFEKGECQEESSRTLDLDEGVQAVACRREKGMCGETALVTVPVKLVESLHQAASALSGEVRTLKSTIEKVEASAAAQDASGKAGEQKGRSDDSARKERLTRVLISALKFVDKEVGLALKEANKN